MSTSVRTLVTGGSGFIGTNLIRALNLTSGSVANLDVAEPLDECMRTHWVEGSVLDGDNIMAVLREFEPHRVVHLAARTDLDHDDDAQAYEVNSVGTENVLTQIQIFGGVERVVLASSMLVFRPGHSPETGSDYSPQNAYGRSKVLGEQVARAVDADAIWTIVRPTTVWGPWNIRLRDEFMSRVERGHYFHPSGENCLRSYGYVGNVVHQILSILEAPRDDVHRRALFVGDPAIVLQSYVDAFSVALTGKSARRLPYGVFKVAALAGDGLQRVGWREPPLTSYRLSNMTSDNILDVSEVLAIAGPGPFGLVEGVEETVRWARSNPSPVSR